MKIIAITDNQSTLPVVKIMVPPSHQSLDEAETEANAAIQRARDEYQLDEAYIARLLEEKGWQTLEYEQVDLEKFR